MRRLLALGLLAVLGAGPAVAWPVMPSVQPVDSGVAAHTQEVLRWARDYGNQRAAQDALATSVSELGQAFQVLGAEGIPAVEARFPKLAPALRGNGMVRLSGVVGLYPSDEAASGLGLQAPVYRVEFAAGQAGLKTVVFYFSGLAPDLRPLNMADVVGTFLYYVPETGTLVGYAVDVRATRLPGAAPTPVPNRRVR